MLTCSHFANRRLEQPPSKAHDCESEIPCPQWAIGLSLAPTAHGTRCLNNATLWPAKSSIAATVICSGAHGAKKVFRRRRGTKTWRNAHISIRSRSRTRRYMFALSVKNSVTPGSTCGFVLTAGTSVAAIHPRTSTQPNTFITQSIRSFVPSSAEKLGFGAMWMSFPPGNWKVAIWSRQPAEAPLGLKHIRPPAPGAGSKPYVIAADPQDGVAHVDPAD